MTLLDTIDNDLKRAMIAKDDVGLRALRAIKSALLIARTEKNAADTLSSEVELKVLQRQVKQRKESADIFIQQNREDLAKIELDELAVIEKYLPAQKSDQEIEDIIKQIIAETGVASPKEMGKVIGLVTAKLAGAADSKTIANMVKKIISGI